MYNSKIHMGIQKTIPQVEYVSTKQNKIYIFAVDQDTGYYLILLGISCR